MSPQPSNEQTAIPAQQNVKPDWAKTARELRREAAGPGRRHGLWPWGLAGLLSLALAAVFALPDQAPSATPAASGVADNATLLHPMDVITVQASTLQKTLPVSGTLHPYMQVEIASRTAGTAEKVEARLGDQVSQGDLLLQIESDNLRAELLQQQAALQASYAQSLLAETQMQRSEKLSDRGLTAEANLESSRSNLKVQAANLEMQRAAVSAAEIALRDTRVLAPFDGVISARNVEPGQTLASGTTVFEMADLSTMSATMNVPVSQTVSLKPGQKVRLTMQGLAGREFVGRVEGISPVASEGSRTSAVKVQMDNPDGLLRGGMFVTGQIEIDSVSDAIAIPQSALREDADGQYVLKIDEDRLIRQAVKVNPSIWGNSQIAVTSGVKASDQIVSGRLPELRDGQKIRIEEPR